MFDRPEASRPANSNKDFSWDWTREESTSQLYKFPAKVESPLGAAGIPGLSIHTGKQASDQTAVKSSEAITSRAGDKAVIEGRFETEDIAAAVASSKERNLPLVAQVGAEWCPHCRHMEKDIWPQVEGNKGLAKSAVVLHLDYEKSESLADAHSLELAEKVKDDVTGFPTIKVFAPGTVEDPIASHSGEMTVAELKTFLKSANVVV